MEGRRLVAEEVAVLLFIKLVGLNVFKFLIKPNILIAVLVYKKPKPDVKA
jgi:hypothetical protein